MYCRKCGRYTEETVCSKCNIPIDPTTSDILDKERPSTLVCIVAFILPILFLIIESFTSDKSPKDRAAIECAKKRLIYTVIIGVTVVVILFTRERVESLFIIFSLMLGFLQLGMIPFMIGCVSNEKKKAIGLRKD